MNSKILIAIVLICGVFACLFFTDNMKTQDVKYSSDVSTENSADNTSDIDSDNTSANETSGNSVENNDDLKINDEDNIFVTDNNGNSSENNITGKNAVRDIRDYSTTETSKEKTSGETTEVVSKETDENKEKKDSKDKKTENKYTENKTLSEDELVDKKIDEMLASMTLEEKVGQIFFIKDDGRFGAEILKDYPVGGIILFKGDFKSGDSTLVKNNIKAFQEETKIPLLIGTDEEGGSVIRLSYFSGLCDKQFMSPRNLYEMGGYDLVVSDTQEKSDVLLDYGINVNFAPVCDYSDVPGAFMYSRSFGANVNETCTYVEKVVSTMKEKKIGSVMKHFPGYGNNGDTHTNVIVDDRPYDDFVNTDFKPFIAGVNAGADCILVSHNIVKSIDENYPASLSIKMNRIIRNEIGFDGVIITDDLMMSGVANLYSKDEVAVRAVLAGNDMILSTDFWTQYNAVLEAAKKGEISVKRLDESIRKIIKWKISIGLL